MKSAAISICLFGLHATAFPSVLRDVVEKRQGLPSTSAAQALSRARTNCGPIPCAVFSATEQYVSTTGDHAYASPAADEIRGPCPGLNAAANHGYISHSGVLTVADTITGLGEAFGMSPDLAGFLAAYAVIFDGDPVLGTWSIGGPPPSDPLTSGLLGGAQGISYSHNKYEGDSSIARGDAYINNGDAHSLQIDRFLSAYKIAVDDGSDRYTLDKYAQNFAVKVQESISNNPYYFAAPFSTTLVSPAAYNFVINFMSNHTAEEPSGYFNGDMFKTFFAVKGDYPNFTWLPGQERIPENWYRRPSSNQYDLLNVGEDLIVEFLAYPDTFRLGGNVNGVNTYEGVDLSNLTSGVMNTDDFFMMNGSSVACFYAQFVQAIVPDAANLPLGWLSPITDLINNYIEPITGSLDCPFIDQFDQGLFNKFPGYTYSPTGPGTNYLK